MKEALTFDDVQILDGYSELNSRSEVDLSLRDPKNGELIMETPVFAAAMDTVTSPAMACAMIGIYGAGVIHHRGQSMQERIDDFKETDFLMSGLPDCKVGANGIAIGLREPISYIKKLIDIGVDIIALEVAAANNKNIMERIKEIGPIIKGSSSRLMVGNFSDAMTFLRKAPNKYIDFVKLSQGGGSVCLTREETGIGKPTFQAAKDAYDIYNKSYFDDMMIVADGGLRKNADIVKSIGAGASAVMLGSMLAGHIENDCGEYRGMASESAKEEAGLESKNIEGTSVKSKDRCQSITRTLDRMTDSMKSGIATAGFESVSNFRGSAKFVKVTNSGVLEASAHAKR